MRKGSASRLLLRATAESGLNAAEFAAGAEMDIFFAMG
jgi:hypothetical protein